jgi:hypothetical protein
MTDSNPPTEFVNNVVTVFLSPLGAVYTCDCAYVSTYDSVYDCLHKVVNNLIFFTNNLS